MIMIIPSCLSSFLKSLLLTALFGVVASAGSVVASPHQTSADNIDAGYSALKLFLEDEQYLTAIRRVKTVITFEGVSKPTSKLIDSIADPTGLIYRYSLASSVLGQKEQK